MFKLPEQIPLAVGSDNELSRLSKKAKISVVSLATVAVGLAGMGVASAAGHQHRGGPPNQNGVTAFAGQGQDSSGPMGQPGQGQRGHGLQSNGTQQGNGTASQVSVGKTSKVVTGSMATAPSSASATPARPARSAGNRTNGATTVTPNVMTSAS